MEESSRKARARWVFVIDFTSLVAFIVVKLVLTWSRRPRALPAASETESFPVYPVHLADSESRPPLLS
jgi:hypothetical protein